MRHLTVAVAAILSGASLLSVPLPLSTYLLAHRMVQVASLDAVQIARNAGIVLG